MNVLLPLKAIIQSYPQPLCQTLSFIRVPINKFNYSWIREEPGVFKS